MGISVRAIESGPDKGKFILTSSFNCHSTSPLTRAEAVLTLHQRSLCDMHLKFIEGWLSFPEGWADNHGQFISSPEGHRRWRDWMDKALSENRTDDSYIDAVKTMYEKCKDECLLEAMRERTAHAVCTTERQTLHDANGKGTA